MYVLCSTKRIIKPNFFQDEYKEDKQKEKDSDPLWDEVPLSFDISDITADVVIFLMEKACSACHGVLTVWRHRPTGSASGRIA